MGINKNSMNFFFIHNHQSSMVVCLWVMVDFGLPWMLLYRIYVWKVVVIIKCFK